MQYLQIYYQQPYLSTHTDCNNLLENSAVASHTSSNLDTAKIDKNRIGLRKESC